MHASRGVVMLCCNGPFGPASGLGALLLYSSPAHRQGKPRGGGMRGDEVGAQGWVIGGLGGVPGWEGEVPLLAPRAQPPRTHIPD